MSEVVKIPLGKGAEYLDTSPKFQGVAAIEIINEDGSSIIVGNPNNGMTLTVSGITSAQANELLNRIKGFQYQPYNAERTNLNPAAEIGDGVTVGSIYSGIYKISRNYGPSVVTDISAPHDEEIEHEYPYISKKDRVYRREIQEAYSRISQTENDITLEVARASSAEGNLSTRITQNANSITSEVNARKSADTSLSTRITQTENSITSEVNARKAADTEIRSTITQTESDIRADVVSRKGGKTSTFGWNLKDDSWTVSGNGKTIFKVTNAGAEIVGKITATSGYIGNGSKGFTITESAIYNGMTSRDDSSHNGVYIGTNGIGVGKGNFRVGSDGNVSIGWGNFTVDTAGNVKAKNMTLTGRLTIGGTAITAEALRSGAQSAYSNGGTWSTGAGYGYNYNNATKTNATSYPASFTCNNLIAKSDVTANSYHYSGHALYLGTIKDYYGNDKKVVMYM